MPLRSHRDPCHQPRARAPVSPVLFGFAAPPERYLYAFSTALLVLLAALVSGCASKPPAPPKTESVATPAPRPAATKPTPTQGSVAVDDAIRRACNLPTPEFAFDSAKIEGDAARDLDAIATCFTKGALAGKSLRVVGHTDPRGETDYNFGLGQRRAGSVASYVEGKGLSSAHVSTTSRGELDAVGNDEQGWARDRRVDLVLAD